MIDIEVTMTEEPPMVVTTERMPYPIDRVWLAHTDELYLKTWWAPEGYENTWAEADVTPGGAWRIVQRDPQGNAFSFYGRYLEVERHARIVQTRTVELFPDATTTLTFEFTEVGNGTQLVTTQVFQTASHLKGFMHLGGVERLRGASQGLDGLLARMDATE